MDNQPVFDQAAALARVDNDWEIFQEITALFFDDSAKLSDDIRQAISQRDQPKLVKAVRALKGSISNFFAIDAFEAAKKLEALARAGQLAEVQAAFDELEKQVEKLVTALWNAVDDVWV